jgi:RNA recognition motif-containing protein
MSRQDNKRKGEGSEEMETDGPKTKRLNAKQKNMTTTDLIVMNLPWKVDEDQLRTYFETYGELLMVQLKKDLEGKSLSLFWVQWSFEQAITVFTLQSDP